MKKEKKEKTIAPVATTRATSCPRDWLACPRCATRHAEEVAASQRAHAALTNMSDEKRMELFAKFTALIDVLPVDCLGIVYEVLERVSVQSKESSPSTSISTN